MKKQSRMIIGITAGTLLIADIVIAAVLILWFSNSDTRKYANHMESAQRYMDELQYEQAIAEYKAAIEIEPNNVEAYQALAGLYVQTGDYESAIAILNQGMEQTGSEELAEYIEKVQVAYEELQALAEASVQEEKIEINDVRIQEEQPKETYEEQGNSVEASVQEEEAEQVEAEQVEVYPEQEMPQEEIQDSQENTERNEAREETVYLSDGDYVIDEYDSYGNLVKETYYYSDGTIAWSRIGEYDVYGNFFDVWYYYFWGTFDYGEVYDAYENFIAMFSYEDDRYHVREYGYAVIGNTGYQYVVKDSVYYADRSLDCIYEYDENGDLAKVTKYNADGTISYVEEY